MVFKPFNIFSLLVLTFGLLSLVCLQPVIGQGTSRGGERGSFTVNWDGVWDTTYGEMVLAQDGSQVRGTYSGVTGRLEGSSHGNTLDFI